VRRLLGCRGLGFRGERDEGGTESLKASGMAGNLALKARTRYDGDLIYKHEGDESDGWTSADKSFRLER
jgi:hypothetical protein